MINGLQLFVHFPLFNMSFPPLANIVVGKLITIASFDILPTDDLFAEIGSPEDDEAYSEKFEGIGYESFFLITALMGLPVLFLIVWFNRLLGAQKSD